MSAPNELLLRLPELTARLGISRSSVYRLVAEGKFPAPLKLTAQTIAFKASEVDQWIAARPRVRS
jgi:prophage regulatory protein